MNTDPIYGPYYLPEVTIKANKPNPLLIPYKAFDKKFNEEMGWNNLSSIEKLLSLLSVPQAFVTYHSTKGKHITPSKALGITNPVGSFITDVLLDLPTPKIGLVDDISKNAVQSSRGVKNLADRLKDALYEDFLRKKPNMDKRMYDLDQLEELISDVTFRKKIPQIKLLPPRESPSLISKTPLTPLEGITPIISVELNVPTDILGSRDLLLPSLAHELGHLYQDLSKFSSKVMHKGTPDDPLSSKVMSFSEEIAEKLSKTLSGNPAMRSMLTEKKISPALSKRLASYLDRDKRYMYRLDEAYPYLTQTLFSIQDRSKLDVSRLSRKSFEDLLFRSNPQFLSNPFHLHNRLLNIYSPKKISDNLYDYIQTHPIFPYIKRF